ncbi:MAG: GerMN domain-containing protein [Vicinamibacteria bacterium]
MTSRQANLLSVLGLVLLLVLVALTAPRWARWLQRPVPAQEDDAATPASPSAEEAASAAAPQRSINVKLFFQAADRPGLLIEERPVAFSTDLSRQIRAVVEELIAGSKSGLLPTLAPEARVLEVFVTARGVAYVSLSKEAAQATGQGSEAELVTVYSVVNSLTVNFPAIKRVQILLEDKPAPTLWGHVDLTRPLPPDMTLMASSTLTPVAAAP